MAEPETQAEQTTEATKEQDNFITEIQKNILEAFTLFDLDSNQTIDKREVGTVLRCLGCFPSEADIGDLIKDMEEEEQTEYIKYDKFLPIVTKVLVEKQYQPTSESKLIKAFELLDTEKKGYLTQEHVTTLLTENGEPFTEEEMQELLSAAVDPEKGVIYYKDFASQLVLEEEA